MAFQEIISFALYAKSFFPSSTIMLSTIGLGAVAYKVGTLALPIIKPFLVTYFKPIMVGIVSMGNVIPLLNHVAKKQDAHQKILGDLHKNQIENSFNIEYKIDAFKKLYQENTVELFSALNTFVEKQKERMDSLLDKLDVLSERVMKLGTYMTVLEDQIKKLKASAEPKSLTYHKEDDFQNGASTLLTSLNSEKLKLNFKEKFLCGEKESYIDEIYNALIKTPSTIMVNMMTETENETNTFAENLRKELTSPLPKFNTPIEEIKPSEPKLDLTKEEEEKLKKEIEQNVSPAVERMSSTLEENKEILNTPSPEVIDQSFTQEERVVKKLSSDQQYSSLYVTKTMLSVVCNSSLGIGFSSFVLSMGLGSLTLYGVSKGLHIPLSAPEDSPFLAKVTSSLISNGSIVLLSTVFMPKLNYQLKKFGEYVQEDLDKNTLYEGGLTKAQIEDKLLEEGISKEEIDFVEETQDPSRHLITFVKILVDDKGAEKAVSLVKNAYFSTKQTSSQVPLLENLSGGISKTSSIKETALEIINNSQ